MKHLILIAFLFAYFSYCKVPKTYKAPKGLIIYSEPYHGEPIPIDRFNKYYKPFFDSIGFKYYIPPIKDTSLPKMPKLKITDPMPI